MGRIGSNMSGTRHAATALTAATIAALALGLSGCIDSATDSSETTLASLVAPSYVTLAPSTSTTVAGATTTTTAPPNVDPSATLAATPQSSTPGTAPAGSTDTSATGTSIASASDGYTVAANDTVYGIARKHGVSAEALAQLNGWSDGTAHNIHPGDSVKVPDGSTATTTAGQSGATSTTARSSTSTTVASGGNTYVIEAGDYLSLIATKTGTTVDAIIAANGWSDGVDHLIIEGQSIKLPAKAG